MEGRVSDMENPGESQMILQPGGYDCKSSLRWRGMLAESNHFKDLEEVTERELWDNGHQEKHWIYGSRKDSFVENSQGRR